MNDGMLTVDDRLAGSRDEEGRRERVGEFAVVHGYSASAIR